MNWKDKKNQNFIEALLSLETKQEAINFLEDLLTEGEIEEFSKRFETARLLYASVSYSQIQKETGFSSTTVARVSKWLNNGTGGYKNILNKIHHHNPILIKKGLVSST